MSKKYENAAKAYEITANTGVDVEEIRESLHALGYELGSKSIEVQHTELGWWLTSHGLDANRADLVQQALINDHKSLVKSYIAAKRSKKNDKKKLGMLQNKLEAAGIKILDDRRLERCLQITADKTKAYKRRNSVIKRAGVKYREETRGAAQTSHEEFFDSEYGRAIESLIMNGASEDDADQILHPLYESYAKGPSDLSALDEAYGEALTIVTAGA